MKKTKRIIVLLLFLVCLFGLCSCSGSTAEETIKAYFKALNALDFKSAGEYLGDSEAYKSVEEALNDNEGTYYERLQSKCFIELIYENVSVKVGSIEEQDGLFSAKCKVSAYSADEVNAYIREKTSLLLQSQAYENADEDEKYVMLCEYIDKIYAGIEKDLNRKENEITVMVEKKGDNYIIKADETLFDAISGK